MTCHFSEIHIPPLPSEPATVCDVEDTQHLRIRHLPSEFLIESVAQHLEEADKEAPDA